jgi:hypothetical protein
VLPPCALFTHDKKFYDTDTSSETNKPRTATRKGSIQLTSCSRKLIQQHHNYCACPHRACTMKFFMDVIIFKSYYARVQVTVGHLHPSLISNICGEGGAYLKPLTAHHSKGIRLGRKWLKVANTLAYYDKKSITTKVRFLQILHLIHLLKYLFFKSRCRSY